MKQNLQKYYTRIIGVFFILVAITLVTDYLQFGIRLETFHKILHVLLGIFVVYFGWNNKKFWQPFCLYNGLFFTVIGLFGFIYPDFMQLDAFNRLDSTLHTIVGVSGLIISRLRT